MALFSFIVLCLSVFGAEITHKLYTLESQVDTFSSHSYLFLMVLLKYLKQASGIIRFAFYIGC